MAPRHPGSGRPAGSGAAFRPIAILTVDASQPTPLVDSADADELVWVEVARDGVIVGVAEATRSAAIDEACRLASEVPDLASSPGDPGNLPSMTVVVPTICKQPAELHRTVEALLATDYPDLEVIIVDNRAADSPSVADVVPIDARVRIAAEPRPGISAARNLGASLATSEVVAFTDDDAVVDLRWLRALGSRFAAEPDVEAIGGLVLPLELETRSQLWFEEYYGGFSRSFVPEVVSLAGDGARRDGLFPYAPGRYGAGCNMAIRRSTLDRIGGFDVELGVGTPSRGGEDLAMFMGLVLAGRTVAFEPRAVVRHAHRRTESEFFRQVRGYGTGLAAMYTSLVVHDPRHLGRILRRVPAAVRLLLRPRAGRSPSHVPSYPRRTVLHQLVGIAYGPVAFARSAAKARRAR